MRAVTIEIARAYSSMLFGHNSNVKVGELLYHVQTEDRGTSHAVIDTMVYHRGRVLHRRANSYADLLPLDSAREHALKDRVNTQHQAVLDELRSGVLRLAQQVQPVATPPVSEPLALELLNAKSWLAGKRATLQVLVFKKDDGEGVSGARVTARIDGAAEPLEYSTATGTDGKAQLAFDMPKLGGAECALVIEGYNGKSQARLHFQLRAKPKIPAAG